MGAHEIHLGRCVDHVRRSDSSCVLCVYDANYFLVQGAG